MWAGSLLHALLWPPTRAWVVQLGAAALLCLALPLLNLASTGQGLWGYLAGDDWQRAGVEAVALGLGLVLACAALRARRPRR